MVAVAGIVAAGALLGVALLPESHPRHQIHTIANHISPDPASPDPASPDETTNPDAPKPDPGIVECVITLASGRKITGELIRENDLIVVVGVNGIETTFQRKAVAKIVILPPVEERYNEMRSAIPDDDIDARLALVEWLRARKAYSLAIEELEAVLRISPSNPHAKLLHTWLTEYNKLRPARKNDTNSTTSSSTTSSSTTSSPSPKNTSRTRHTRTPNRLERNTIPPLTPEQINLMRVYEIDLRDPPRLRVPDETLQTLMTRKPDAFSPNKEQRDAIFKLPEIEKLKILFTHKARDLYPQVIVLEDPQSMKNFKENVHAQRGWLINACATTRCHGGPDAGDFRLINTRTNSDATVYTNFLIIEQYTLPNGSPLIDYQAPERSPLLQMGMVSKNALTPHPEIPEGFPGTGFRPIFRSTRDRKYRDAIEWIRSMYQPRPEYDFLNPTQPEPKPNRPEQSTP